MKTKFIFVTGGVVSGLGKGVCAASIGYLLKSRGYSVFSMKLDPYLNVNPGMISPIEHGEVFVTDDGTETDLDLGYYERFIGTNLTKDSSFTSGKLYQNLWKKESEGIYKGKTLQIIPHFTNEVQEVILNIEKKYNPDFAIIEIGGSVGDLESNPFFYSIAQLNYLYPNNMFFVHISFVPFLEVSKEYKSKPTQHSIEKLRSLGINPNIVILRSHNFVTQEIINKISKISFLNIKNIFNVPDIDIVYKIPLYLEEKNIVKIITNHFNLKNHNANLNSWHNFVKNIENEDKQNINIAMCGKYASFEDSYKSIKEALMIAAGYEKVNINFIWIDLLKLTPKEIIEILKSNNINGIIALPGKEYTGWDNETLIANYGRKNNIPTLGICWGFQAMVIDCLKENNPNIESIEFIKETKIKNPLFITEKVQKYNEIDFNVRIGQRKIKLNNNTLINKIYDVKEILERHKHKFCIPYHLVKQYENNNIIFSSLSENGEIVESFEIKDHPFYLGVQFHPEYNVKVLAPGNLFRTFLKSTKQIIKINNKEK